MVDLIRHIKFDYSFDVERLQFDVTKALSLNWINHYNTEAYSGNWSSIALMSQGGNIDNIYALPSNSHEVINTEILESCSYFKEIIERFPFQKTSVRLLCLAAGAEIKPHKDYCLGYEDGCFRIHIPVITNKEVEFILDDEKLYMAEGECWYINANFTHSVANRGKQDRIHLVIDGIRNTWTDELFFQYANKEGFIKSSTVLNNKSDINKVIEELKKMNTPVAEKLISDLLKEKE
jgi:quercetin dioxygenase-like cupin family protein